MLGAVVASLDLALEDLRSDDSIREDALNAREAAGRAAKTSELMLAYLGQTVGNRETVDLTQVLRDALPTLESSIPANAKLTLDLRESGLIVLVSPAQITQMLGNLITNAWESMGGADGEIRVSVKAVSSARIPKTHLASADFRARAASYVCLEVRDRGCGKSAETIEKIFDPFFTTKFLGRGLGLAVVLGTVRAYDGVISVGSVIGEGSAFRIYLPHAPLALLEGRSAASAPSLSEARGANSPVVLVAEDEENVLFAMQRMFERMGYEVVSATDGAVAVERFRDCAKDVCLAVLDLAMPKMDGWATLAAVRSLRPDIPVILTSGYDDEVEALRGQPSHHSLFFLHKPYSFADLRSVVASTLAAGEAHARGLPKGGPG
jgi:two-component system cell cycle sensor histidine kinase/response regulator CckA